MQSARDYYYMFIAPEERGMNYSQIHHSRLKEPDSSLRRDLGDGATDRFFSRVKTFEPRLSNDVLLEDLMQELVKSNLDPLRSQLQKVFVAKRLSLFANAAALPKAPDYDGHLVFFFVGLSDAAYQYSILFRHFAELRQKLLERDYEAPKRFAEMVNRVSLAQERWQKSGSYIQLALDDQLDQGADKDGKAANIAACTDRFILAHEVSHHILGHSDGAQQAFKALSYGSQPLIPQINLVPESWRQELAADSAAIGMILGNSPKSAERMFVTAALGSLLTITVIGQLSADAHVGTESHPPPEMRYINAVLTLDSVRDQALNHIRKDVNNFQTVLYRSMSKGIGRYSADTIE